MPFASHPAANGTIHAHPGDVTACARQCTVEHFQFSTPAPIKPETPRISPLRKVKETSLTPGPQIIDFQADISGASRCGY